MSRSGPDAQKRDFERRAEALIAAAKGLELTPQQVVMIAARDICHRNDKTEAVGMLRFLADRIEQDQLKVPGSFTPDPDAN